VYWHVGSKADLIALAGDHVWTQIALPDLTAPYWRTAASRMAVDLHAMLTRHAWLVAFGSYPVFGLGKARQCRPGVRPGRHQLLAHVAARAIVLIQADNPAIAWWLSSPSAWWSVVVPDRCRRRARTPLGRGRRTRLFPVRRLAALPGSQPGVISEFALGAVPQPGASVVRVRSDSPPSSPGLNIASPGAFRA